MRDVATICLVIWIGVSALMFYHQQQQINNYRELRCAFIVEEDGSVSLQTNDAKRDECNAR